MHTVAQPEQKYYCPGSFFTGPSCPEISSVLKFEIVLKFYSFGKNDLKMAFGAQ